jgi:hypothetical protein
VALSGHLSPSIDPALFAVMKITRATAPITTRSSNICADTTSAPDRCAA